MESKQKNKRILCHNNFYRYLKLFCCTYSTFSALHNSLHIYKAYSSGQFDLILKPASDVCTVTN